MKMHSMKYERYSTKLRKMPALLLMYCCLLSTLGICSAYSAASDPRTSRKPIARFSGSPSFLLETPEKSKTTPIKWLFKGHECYAEKSLPNESAISLFGTSKPDVVLIHGFGCSSYYWRESRKAFNSAGYTVHTIDLLGQGKSAKPGRADGIEYSIDLWAEMVDEYIKEFIPKSRNVVLVGNSLGSIVALSAATGDHGAKTTLPSRIQGIGMFNCGVGLNSRNLLKDTDLNVVQKIVFTFLFNTLDNLVFDNIPLLTYVLQSVVTKDLLRNVLVGLYNCAPEPKSRIDDGLVDSFYFPAKEEGSVEALNQIYTNDAGKTPRQIHEDHAEFLKNIPLHLVWGIEDQVTPIAGPVGKFYLDMVKAGNLPVSFSSVQAGHVPFDEIPECNEFMVQWLEDVVMDFKREDSKASFFSWPF